MNTHKRNGGDDRSLDEGLDKLGRAYRRLEADHPPDLLDQAVLSSAHRALGKRPGWMQFGWLHGLATTAVFVLAFTLVLVQREPAPETAVIEFESSPAPSGSELTSEDRAQQDTPAALMKMAPEQSAKSHVAIQKSAEPKEEGLLERRTDANLATRQLEVVQEEEQAPRSRAEAHDLGRAQIAPVSIRPEDKDTMQDEVNSMAEQELAEIIRLKKAGDETWHQSLEMFREKYPDYPLPAELED